MRIHEGGPVCSAQSVCRVAEQKGLEGDGGYAPAVADPAHKTWT